MKPFPPSVDRMPLSLRDKTAGPLLDIDEAIFNGLLYAMKYEFWKAPRRLTANSLPVKAIRDAVRLAGYSIVPTEAKRGE